MNSRFLETFLWVTRLKSFSRTADRMHATQPAISNRIAKLEEILGVNLYNRSSKEFELTEAGRRIIPYAEEIVKMTSMLIDSARAEYELSGDFRIGAVEMATISWVPDYIRIIQSEFPNVNVTFTSDTTSRLIEALSEDEIDLAITFGPVNFPGITSISVGNCPLRWLASPRAFDLSKEIGVVELSRLPLISLRRESSAYDIIASYFKSYDVDPVQNLTRSIFIENVYSGSSALHMVKEGLGVVALPPIMCVKDIADGSIGVLNVTQQLPCFHLTICYKSPARSRVIEHLACAAKDAAVRFAQTCERDHFWI